MEKQGVYCVKKIGYPLIFITLLLTWSGCGEDTHIDQNQAARVDNVKLNYYEIDQNRWQVEIQVIFSQPPISLQLIEDEVVLSRKKKKVKWEQVGNIVTIYLNFGKLLYIPTYELYFTLNWNTGRKQIDTILKPPANIATKIPDKPNIPNASFVSVTPTSGGNLAANGSISITFDNNPGDVTVSAGSVTTSGKTRTISAPAGGFPVGAITINIVWTNGDGFHDLTYNVVAAD